MNTVKLGYKLLNHKLLLRKGDKQQYSTKITSLLFLFIVSISISYSQIKSESGKLVLLKNGVILTMDKSNSIAKNVLINGNMIVALNDEAVLKGKNAIVVDLKGKTVIPGLIDSHIHFMRQGLMPGYVITEAENSSDINSLLTLIRGSSKKTSSDKWITVMGGIAPLQFSEKRLPTLQEIDAQNISNPVYLQTGFDGPSVVNTTAKNLLSKNNISVDENGNISAGVQTIKAFEYLKSLQKGEDKYSTTKNLMTYANTLGLTSIIDEAGTSFGGASNFNPYQDYQTIEQFWKEKNLTIRIRVQHVAQDSSSKKQLLEERIYFGWNFLGDDMLRITSTGEHIVTFPNNNKVNAAYYDKGLLVAKEGFSNEQHSSSITENEQHVGFIEKINEKYPIEKLRWSLAHVFELGHPQSTQMIARIKALGLGLRLQNQGYLHETDVFPLGRTLGGQLSGPYFKTLYDEGFVLGGGTDGPLLGPMNPWLSIYYIVSGKNAAGKIVNTGQTLSRLEALRLYTIGSAWFCFDEQKLGSIEPGKMADMVVLNNDFLNIPVEQIKSIYSDLTIVDGRIVWAKNGVYFFETNKN